MVKVYDYMEAYTSHDVKEFVSLEDYQVLQAKLDKAVVVIEKYKDIAWATGGKITREESMAAQSFLAEIGKG